MFLSITGVSILRAQDLTDNFSAFISIFKVFVLWTRRWESRNIFNSMVIAHKEHRVPSVFLRSPLKIEQHNCLKSIFSCKEIQVW